MAAGPDRSGDDPDDLARRLAALTARVDDLERQLAEARAPGPPPTPPSAVPVPAPPPPNPGARIGPPPNPAGPPRPPAPGVPGPPPSPSGATPWAGPTSGAGVPWPAGSRPGFGPGSGPPRPGRTPLPTTEQLLRWAGVALVVLAALTLVGTAISRGWIGPELQLAGATVIGLALLAAALVLDPDRRPWAVACAVGAAVILPACAGAAYAGLDLVPLEVALGLLALSVAVLVAVAVRLDLSSAALVVLVTSLVVALWVTTEEDSSPLVTGLALTAVMVVASALGWWRRWVAVRLATVLVGGFLLWAVIPLTLVIDPGDLDATSAAVAVAALIAVAALAWVGPLVPLPTRAMDGGLHGVDRRAVILVPIWVWTVTSAVVRYQETEPFFFAGLVTAAVAASSAVGLRFLAGSASTVGAAEADADAAGAAAPLARADADAAAGPAVPGSVTGAHVAGAVLVALAAVLLIAEGPTGLVAAGLAVALLALVARWVRDLFPAVIGVLVAVPTLLATVGFLFEGVVDPPSVRVLVATAWIIGLVVALAVITVQWQLASELATAAVIVAWVLGLVWLAAALVHGPQGQVALSLAWAAAAVTGLVVGIVFDRLLFRGLGLATLGLVLAKLLTVDLAEVDTLWRVGLFLIIGLGLLRLGYLLPRLSARAAARLR